MRSLICIALVFAAAQVSSAGKCVPVSEAPLFNEYGLKTVRHDGFTLSFGGFVNYTSSDGNTLYLPLSLNDFDLDSEKKTELNGRTLNLHFDCGTLVIAELSREWEYKSQALYSLWSFEPATEINGLSHFSIESAPASTQYDPTGQLVRVAKNYPMFIAPGQAVANLHVQNMFLDNGAKLRDECENC